jgi:hypothetical protein
MATVVVTGCGGSTSPAAPSPVVLLDTTVTLTAGVNCAVGYVGAEFNGSAGTTVTISATGDVSLAPLFVLYAPDFTMQLGVSSSRSAGTALLTSALTQSGVHHLSICSVNGIAGLLRITVQQT